MIQRKLAIQYGRQQIAIHSTLHYSHILGNILNKLTVKVHGKSLFLLHLHRHLRLLLLLLLNLYPILFTLSPILFTLYFLLIIIK